MDKKTLTTTPPDPESKRFEVEVPRRNFLGLAAMTTFVASWCVGILGALRLPVPAVFPEANPRFRIGKADKYPKGSKTRIRGRNVWIFHDDKGLFAISAICTHLGCIVEREGVDFICPCHGSKFDSEGLVMSGPAPGRLPWLEIGLDPSGDLYIDSESTVDQGTRFVV